MSSPATMHTTPSIDSDEDALDPIATQSSRDRVAVLAYQLWQERGCPDGSPEIDWFEAKQLIAEQPLAMPPLGATR